MANVRKHQVDVIHWPDCNARMEPMDEQPALDLTGSGEAVCQRYRCPKDGAEVVVCLSEYAR